MPISLNCRHTTTGSIFNVFNNVPTPNYFFFTKAANDHWHH